MRDPRHDVLFTPLTLGPVTSPNRFYQAPHATGIGESPRASAHLRGVRAEGGWGVVNTEAVKITEQSDMSGRRRMSWLLDQQDTANWSLTCDAVHEHGSLVGIELFASGVAGSGLDQRSPAQSV